MSDDIFKQFGLEPIGHPWAHQIEGVIRSLPYEGFCFFFETGTGKTYTAILTARVKMALDKKQYRVLVVTPLITQKNWMYEWRKFSPIDHAKIIPLLGSGKKRVEQVDDNAQVIIASYESMTMNPVFDRIMAWGPDILIVDELHKCKSHTSRRSKAVHKMATLAKYRIGLTGTPMLKDPMDLFSQLKAIDLGGTFGHNFHQFKNTYFFDANAGRATLKNFPLWVVRKGAADAIAKKLQPITMTAKKSLCLDLPPYIVKNVEVPISGEQLRFYNDLKKDFIAYIDGKQCVTTMAMTKAMRMLQVIAGFCMLEDMEGNKYERAFDENPRKGALKEVVESLPPDAKYLIWTVHRRTYQDIRETLDGIGHRFVELHGEVSPKDKFKAVDDFTNDPSIRAVIGHPLSGGVGVNLIAASYNIYYTRDWSLEAYLQSQARCYRGGSERHTSITEINLVTPDSIDETVMKRLASKQEASDRMIYDIAKELK